MRRPLARVVDGRDGGERALSPNSNDSQDDAACATRKEVPTRRASVDAIVQQDRQCLGGDGAHGEMALVVASRDRSRPEAAADNSDDDDDVAAAAAEIVDGTGIFRRAHPRKRRPARQPQEQTEEPALPRGGRRSSRPHAAVVVRHEQR